MKKTPNIDELRQKAEEAFKDSDLNLFDELLELIKQSSEELSLYQAELAAQNDELEIIRTELDASNEKYKILYDSAPTGYFTFDEHGTIKSANKTAAAMLDISIKEITGKSMTEFILPEDQDTFYFHLKSTVNFEHSQNCKLRLVSNTGRYLIISGESKAIEKNGMFEIHSSFSDISELAKSQELIEEQEILFQNLFDKAGDANFLLSSADYIDCNIKALEIFGLESKDELIGKHPFDFSPEYQPCGKKSIDKAKEMIEISYEKGANHFEWLHTNKKTGLIYTDVMLTSITKEGQNLILVTLRDITEKKQSEEELRQSEANLLATINYSNVAISLFSKDGILRKFNERFVYGVKLYSGVDVYPEIHISKLIGELSDKDYWKEKLDIVLSGESVKFERKIDKSNSFFEFAFNPVFVNNEVAGFCIFTTDISKYRLAEKILKESNEDLEERVNARSSELKQQAEFLSVLIESIPDLLFVKDTNGKYLNCNAAYCNYTGKPKEEIIGRTDFELYSEEDAKQFVEFDSKMLESKSLIRSEQVLTFPDKSQYTFDTIKIPYFDENQEIAGVIGISRDITEIKKLEEDIKKINQELEVIIEKRTLKLQQEIHERVRAEEALKKSREMYRNLFNDVPVGIYRTTLDGSIILANPALVEMLGFNSINELKNRNLNVEGFKDQNERQSFLSNLLSGEDIIEFETTWLKKDGSELFVLEKAKAIRDYSRNVIYIEGTAEDISDRKIAERMQQTVYSISEAAYKVQNLDELYEFIHRAVAGLIFGRNFYIALYDEHKKEIAFPYLVDEMESPIASKISSYPVGNGLTEYVIKTGTFQLLNKDSIKSLENSGELFVNGPMPVSWLGVPLVTTENKIIGVLAVQSYDTINRYDINAKDILVFVSTQIAMVIYRKHIEEALYSERKYLAERVLERTEELSALNAELERAVRTKDEFLANMSHELRTPLNAILGLSEIMLKHKELYENDKHKRALTTIRESGSHLLNLINDILDLSKIEAGKMELNFEELNVNQIANTSLNFVKQLALKKSINISLQISDDCPEKFFADAVRLKQILINLLNNAVKFTSSEGQVGLDITYNEPNKSIHFTVWDTGIGISEENIQRLFKPFTQLSSNLSRDFEGTGLGLSLVSKLTEMHGGSVCVESDIGIGSKFTIALPVKSLVLTAKDLELASKSELENIKLALIIEDSGDDSVILADFLARLNVKSELFQFDLDIEDVLLSKKYDIIFLDILLWDRSGWDILSIVKKNAKISNIPVIVTTVLKERARATAYGADGFLNKPYSFSALYDVLNKIDLKYEQYKLSEHYQEGFTAVMENKTIVLLAEDNEANLQTLETFLEYAGFTVVVARNGREAIDTAVEYHPNIILMDIQMPKMDGLEAIRIIKQDNLLAEIPIIALTALAMPGDKERCLAAGANEYLSKPVNFDTLINAMNLLLPEDKRKESE